jgi:undecaprenyl-diphosphatase
MAGVFPGTSRSGATILMALAMGVSRPAATQFSFLLGIPTLFAAGGLELATTLSNQSPEVPVAWNMLLLGSFAAAVSAFAVVKWLLKFVQTHTFILFGWYRIVMAILILALPILLRSS